ncbi:conjugative transposon protein TraJ [Puia sp. P3]|uniref:conjugative transposon protein TraJ n=1 Tax=Puia sp. P3 TaxID=3423952 RepID=UPI003D675F73
MAGFGTLFYIGFRVWKHIARAEPVDFFPLLRPLVLTILIGFFPQVVLNTLNSILEPTVTATAKIVDDENAAVLNLISLQARTIGGDTTQQVVMNPYDFGSNRGPDQYTDPSATTSGTSDSGGFWSSIGSGLKFLMSGMYNSLKVIFQFFLSLILQVLYYAASLCIDTIRTFHLIVLAILGPLAFAFSCYDGLQNSLTHWLARYINIYLWLPIANIFGAILAKIQENMLKADLASGTAHFVQTEITYLIFLVIGIVGYFTVPGIANYIIHTHGPNPLAQKVSNLAQTAVSVAATAATGVPVGAGGGGGGTNPTAATGYQDSQGAAKSEPNAYTRKQIEG